MSDSINKPLAKISEIEGRGRGIVASQPVKAGQIILRDSPILVYSAIPFNQNGIISSTTSSSKNYCSNCFRMLNPSTSLFPCPSCSHLFCSPPCRSLALTSSHTPWVCQAFSSLSHFPSSSLDPDVQIKANFLIAAYNLSLVSPSNFRLLLSLQGEAPPNPDTIATILHSLISSLPPPSPPPPQSFAVFSPELTAALLAKDNLNAFGLMEPFQGNNGGEEPTVRAYAIYPKASFFNHDCLPNACRFDYLDSENQNHHLGNTDIIVRAIHDIPLGREICLSYFPVNFTYPERQKRLLEDYGFACDCDRCKVEMNWSDPDDDDDDEEEENNMEEEGEQMELADENQNGAEGDSDFPHAYFFLRYICDRENCRGTLAPLPPSEHNQSHVMECNVCGRLRTEENIDGDGDGGEVGIMLDS